MRRLFAPEFQAAHPDLMAGSPRGFPAHRSRRCFAPPAMRWRALDLRPELGKVSVPALVLVGEHDEATPPPMSHELAAGLPQALSGDHPGLCPCACNCSRRGCFWMSSVASCR